jgi:hypothetical protein
MSRRTVVKREPRHEYEWAGVHPWVDPVGGEVVMFDSLHLDSCCPHESWWRVTDGDACHQFRATGPLEFTPRLEAYYDTQPATSGMTAAWIRFCETKRRVWRSTGVVPR